ncbi:VWA domain-containing protein [bacterium]|nr:VWA domain-containing protein [bacterium]
MFQPFFLTLRKTGVPVTLGEYLGFLAAVQSGLVTHDPTGFYHLARLALVKDERFFDRFDRAFAESFQGLEAIAPETVLQALNLPADWLRANLARHLTEEERAAVQAQGGLEALMEALRQRLAEQKGRHEGGSKWVGTGGTSPFGHAGFNPEGLRIGGAGGQNRAVKVWEAREFRNLDEDAELGPRTLKLALRALRRWARAGAARFDLPATIDATARSGWLDVQERPERRNAVRVLLFLDIGGSMDGHVMAAQALFAAARAEFRDLAVFYFHNCLYESVWTDNARRQSSTIPTWDVLRRYGPDHRAIFVGDAAMSPYEVDAPGGSVEHWNPEPGRLWLQRACQHWMRHLWINPVPEPQWGYTRSTGLIRDIFKDRMVPLTLAGLSRGIKDLR